MASAATNAFLQAKFVSLVARSRRLTRLTPRQLGLRAQDMPYAPSSDHFRAANRRLAAIARGVESRVGQLRAMWPSGDRERKLIGMAMFEREVDRARRSFGMFFEIFIQRGTSYAPVLAAHDVIAADCYAAVRAAAPEVLPTPLLKPVTYMEHGYSPSTQRRGVQMARLLGDTNPFPVIRIPWDRDNPWQSVFLHEVSHNLQADMRLWTENQTALAGRMQRIAPNPRVAQIWRRWHKEIFADLAAILLGGPASAAGMMTFLSHPAPRALTYRPGGAHPTGYIRAFIMSNMLSRMGFADDARDVERVWRELYDPRKGHRLPPALLESMPRVVPHVVDEVAFQPRLALGQRALADVIPFTRADQAAIRRGAIELAAGRIPAGLPPRFMVSASGMALAMGADPDQLSQRVVAHLAAIAAASRAHSTIPNRLAA